MMLIILSTVLIPGVFSNWTAKEKEEDFCKLKPYIGHCDEEHKRWYYDPLALKCKLFKYSGCGGNDNRFLTRYLCEVACSDKRPITDEMEKICSLPLVEGSCDENLRRWHYNVKEEKCEEFRFRGCKQNANNFVTEKECLKQCKDL
ncbi:papilin [Trichonephila inaurata madagascariensis]|uniref:Papilin n=1 Tax=Trichonephila inaurata madagascariensis TaxID=2747483 RepID=A0A8X6XTL6_9ARAC|nr:papilin [Trichonephila inaurata madagascariensis]